MAWKPQPRYDKSRKSWFCRVNKVKSYLGVDEADAYRRFAEIIAGSSPSDRPATVAEAIETWLAIHGHANKSWRWQMLQAWTEFAGALPLSRIGADHLAAYRTRLEKAELGRQTVIHKVRSASMVLRWAEDAGYIDKAPKVPKMPKAVRKPRDVDDKTMADAFAKLRDHAAAVLGFIAETGCRPSEARLLKWSEVDIGKRLVTKTKHKTDYGGKLRHIALTDAAVEILKSRKKSGDYVFLSRLGKPYTRTGLAAIATRNGLPGTYCLRHTFAQHVLDADVSLDDLGGLLNHSDPNTTRIYAQVRLDRTRKVADSLTALVPPRPDADRMPQTGAARRKAKRATPPKKRERAKRRAS